MAGIDSLQLDAASWVPPAEWAAAATPKRLRYLTRVAELAEAEKRRQLVLGIGANGRKLAKVLPTSRPDGATGPALSPHRVESRSQARLRSAVGVKGGTVTLFWGNGWGRIMGYHARGEVKGAPVRDAIGFPKAAAARIEAGAVAYWRSLTRRARPKPTPPPPAPAASRRAPAVVYLPANRRPAARSKDIQVY